MFETNKRSNTNKIFHGNSINKEIIDLSEEFQSALKKKGLNLDLKLYYHTKNNWITLKRGDNEALIEPEIDEANLLVNLVELLGFTYEEAKRIVKPLKWSINETTSIYKRSQDPIGELINDLEVEFEDLFEMLKDNYLGYAEKLRLELIERVRNDREAIEDVRRTPIEETFKKARNDRLAYHMVKILTEKGLRMIKVGGRGLLLIARRCYARDWDVDSLASTIASIYGVLKTGLLKAIKDALWTLAEDVGVDLLNPQGLLLFKNGVLDLKTLSFTPISQVKGYVFTSMINHNFDHAILSRLKEMKIEDWEREVPKFLSLIKRLFNEEFEKSLEMLGSLLIPSVIRKIFIVYGEPRTGKSTLLSLLLRCFPKLFTTTSLLALKERFNYMLMGKFAILTSEVSDVIVDEELISRLNRLTGDPEIEYEEKFKPKVQGKNMVKVVVATNDLPLFKKLDEALIDRLYLIEVTGEKLDEAKSIEEVVSEILTEEGEKITYFILWCMLRVYDPATGRLNFKHDLDVEEKKELLLEKLNPVAEWIEECCVREGYASRKVLYDHYVEWSKRSGKRILTRHQFYGLLRSMGYLEATIDGTPCFKGLSLKVEERKKTIEEYLGE